MLPEAVVYHVLPGGAPPRIAAKNVLKKVVEAPPAVKVAMSHKSIAAPEHKADREIVLESVKQVRHAGEQAAPEHKADGEVVLEAAKQSGSSPQDAAQEHVAVISCSKP